ncbi:hypothetical protein RDI58_012323 [Solanum bulbocastanum]|uniref:Ubiquinone biosynthesis protein COQ4 homolog, mitochondrial n=1 Tax=Solanum bulbocastanum TaxID=147425 RepID=A0AAN8TIP3_SOLBU
MATVNEIVSFTYLGLSKAVSPKRCRWGIPQTWLKWRSSWVLGGVGCSSRNPSFVNPKRTGFKLFNSVELGSFVTSDDEEKNEMSDCFFEAIEELERMTREPSDVLEEMNERLSDRELQLVLVYFAQEGRDSWCALEVFEWLRKENRVDKETMELMVSIMCGWVQKLIGSKSEAGDVVDLLVDMDCVGLNPSFSMVEKVISLYWDAGEREGSVLFVKEVLRRQIAYSDGNVDGHKAGPAGYLAWKMMEEGNYKDAVKLVIDIRDSGLKPELYSYLIAMTAVVKELNEFGKALRKLKGFARTGLVAELDLENLGLIEEYQADLLAEGVQLSDWLIQEGGPSLFGVVHERLLAMYVCAGRGIEAERHLWQMKLSGKEVTGDLQDIVLAICASQKELGPISRLLTGMEASSSLQKKKTLSWLLRGYIKGGHLENAAETVIKMLDLGLYPDFLDRAAVLQRLRRRIQQSGSLETYLNLCKHLSDASLIGAKQTPNKTRTSFQLCSFSLYLFVKLIELGCHDTRADLIAALGETTGKPAFDRVLERMKKSPEGREILLERPRVISTNVGHAWDLPDNTFGAAYARFMGSRNFSPDDRPPVRFMETEELAYVAMRAREVHDFWHTLFDLPTNLIGETALKVIEFEQMLLPMCLMSVLGGTARFSDKQRSLFYQHYFPWAFRAGARSTDLMCVYYEKHFHEDLEDVRRKWGIIPAPPPPIPNATIVVPL